MSTPHAKRIFDAFTSFLDDIVCRVFPPSEIRHPVQIEKAVLRAIDREGIYLFLRETYVCNVVMVLLAPADLEFCKTFPKTFREELLQTICEHIRGNYGHAKNKDEDIELKIIEDSELTSGKVDVETRFEEARRRRQT